MREKVINSIKILIIVLIGFGAGGAATYYLVENKLNNEVTSDKTTSTTTSGVVKCNNDITIDETGISTAVGKIYDATTTIQNYQSNTLASSGSGFIYKKDSKYAYILTNYHVVEHADKLVITLSSDDQEEGTYLGGDEYLDLAVVRISAKNITQVATLGNSEKTNVGDTVFTVGSPVGYEYRGSVTKGILSGKNRMITVSVNSNSDWVMNVLQIDATINPGNSGGPLLNEKGQIVGINTAKTANAEGIGFAIPINVAKPIVEQVIKTGTFDKVTLGIKGMSLSAFESLVGADLEAEDGVYVVEVQDKTPAKSSGMKIGDVIESINGEKITDMNGLTKQLYKFKDGDTCEVVINRSGEKVNLKVKFKKTISNSAQKDN